jgi:uncharacterized protein YraI
VKPELTGGARRRPFSFCRLTNASIGRRAAAASIVASAIQISFGESDRFVESEMSRPVKVHLAVVLLIASCAVASARTALIDNKLNLRQGPGQEHRVIVVMPAGANVTVGECRGEWCKVEFRGQRGYASSALLSGGDAALAAAPPVGTQAATKYDANDEVRVLNWNDREWRDRYWREMNLRKPRQ